MRKTLKSVSIVFFVLLFPFSLTIGQDMKSEQKIKIVVDEGNGKKVVVDTVFKNSSVPDSLILKDGTVVLIKHPGEESGLKHHNGKDHFFVTYSTSGKDNGKEYKEMTIISSDSLNKNISSGDDDDKNLDVYISDDGKDSNIEKNRYVIAKDGMVVTVEGRDDAKTKELVREIESKMGVNNEEHGKKEKVNTETKKTIRK